jgi:hypothetical protein
VCNAVVTLICHQPLLAAHVTCHLHRLPLCFAIVTLLCDQVLRTSGPRSLYFGFVPYCLESWPYDVSELLVVGAASDVRGAPGLANIKPAVFDMTVGALAGTVAVSCNDGRLGCMHALLLLLSAERQTQ